MSEAPSRPVPAPDRYVPSKPFWENAKQGRLVLQYCRDTQRFQHPPHPLSLYTGSQNVEWREVEGRGTIYAATVVRVPGPGVTGRLPLSVATVELAEGVRIIANIVDSDAGDIRIGAAVALAWDHLDGGTPYPAFRIVPVGDRGGA
ncbi:OB-fold domain-containing protein (plasmid) [Bosea vestrisii]|uniref:Zn-ribbon domain-containing OB-fold protein n=1 Tax=Bosea vestrisii TaxID=151416 RepID=UPI0024E02145|nr:OB-fold domain-containing protein [Bosea vestrisii]WID99808.1 OB-fold domain-containing protein [Bosea vestrisii]